MAGATAPKLRKVLKKASNTPSLSVERLLWEDGHDVIVGVDEVGRGSWAGPLAVGAAVLPRDQRVNKVRDSKLLSEPEREALFDRIAGW
jgi:ribonuclease HII